MFINEGLRQNDLEHLVSNYISIDEYSSKLDDDNITIAIYVNQLDVANELKDLIEKTYFIEIRDIEISETMTIDNKYILFIEFDRDELFPKVILDILDTIYYATNNKKWFFKTIGLEEHVEVTEENIIEHIRLTKLEDGENVETKDSEEVKESFEPIYIDDNGWKRQYIPQGYISQEKMNRLINESETINERDDYELYLLESTFYGSEIITTDKNIFVINGDKILMLK